MLLSYSPATNRALGSAANATIKGETSFYLGAGVDIAIVSDSKSNKRLKNWQELIHQFIPANLLSSASLENAFMKHWLKERQENLKAWPTEIGFLSKTVLGKRKFEQFISSHLYADIIPNLKNKNTYTWKLASLLSSSNLIVTTNYTDYIENVLRKYLEIDERECQLIIIDREDLSSFQFPQPEKKPRIIYLIYLHGRTAPLSEPILDAWGYNVVQNEDVNYRLFLNELFSKRSVITIGASWADIPLRNAAAFVKRTKPYLKNHHLSLMHEKGGKKKLEFLKRKVGLYRTWSISMRACYGTEIIPYVNNISSRVLDRIAISRDPLDSINLDLKNLQTIADFLDNQGDYESQLHHDWIKKLGSPEEKLLELANGTIRFLETNPEDWPIAAKIERHLRHHLYLYKKNDDKDKNDNENEHVRFKLWNEVCQAAKRYPNCVENDPRIWFDLFIGQYELAHLNSPLDNKTHNHWKHLISKDIILLDRAELASMVWKGPASMELVDKLINTGWESIAAKVALDFVRDKVKVAKEKKLNQSSEVYEYAIQGAQLASAAGCRRREVMGDVLASLWNVNSRDARLLMLGRCLTNIELLEKPLIDGIATAIISCYLSPISKTETYDFKLLDLDQWVKSAGIKEWDIKNVRDYWIKQAPTYIENTMINILPEPRN